MLNEPKATPSEGDAPSSADTSTPRRRRGRDKVPRRKPHEASGLVAAKPALAAKPRLFRYVDCMIAYTPTWAAAEGFRATVGQVVVGPYPDLSGWSSGLACHLGGPQITKSYLTRDQAAAAVLADFHKIVTDGGVRVGVAHAALLRVREFACGISATSDGADQRGRPRESNAAPRSF